MKIRQGFVSNSSTSSFVVISAGDHDILEDGYIDEDFSTDSARFPIDDIIEKLLKAKADGATEVYVVHGGGYDG